MMGYQQAEPAVTMSATGRQFGRVFHQPLFSCCSPHCCLRADQERRLRA